MSAALKIPMPQLPEPKFQLGTAGMAEWRETLTAYPNWADWAPHEFITLACACRAADEVARLSKELEVATDFKTRRQVRADMLAAMNAHRQQTRELALFDAPEDTRPPLINGRYR